MVHGSSTVSQNLLELLQDFRLDIFTWDGINGIEVLGFPIPKTQSLNRMKKWRVDFFLI